MDDPDIVARVIKFLYTGVYDPVEINVSFGCAWSEYRNDEDLAALAEKRVLDEAYLNILVYQVSDRLGIPRLRNEAFNHLKSMSMAKVLKQKLSAELLDYIFHHTSPRDMKLRPFIIGECIKLWKSMTKYKHEIFKVMSEHELMAWTIGLDLISEVKQI